MNSSDVTIHVVTALNAKLLDRIDPDVFDYEVQPALLAQYLATPNNLLLVAVADDEVIGMVSGLTYVHPDKPLQLFVNEVGVSSRFQRRGVGRLLIDALLEHARSLGCHEAWVATEVDNAPARALYASTGAVEDDEHAVVYVYSLRDGLSK